MTQINGSGMNRHRIVGAALSSLPIDCADVEGIIHGACARVVLKDGSAYGFFTGSMDEAAALKEKFGMELGKYLEEVGVFKPGRIYIMSHESPYPRIIKMMPKRNSCLNHRYTRFPECDTDSVVTDETAFRIAIVREIKEV